jgi:hypothetical protein
MKLFLLAVAVFGVINARSLYERGLSRDDKWFDGLRDLGTEVIVETFDLEGAKEQVRQNVEDCMQQADVTSCLEGKVDAVSDGLGDKVSKADRDDAKIKVAALADFLAAVHGACADKPEDEIAKCAFAVGKHMCEASDFDMKKCMGGVKFVLEKAKQMAEAGDKKRGLSRDDKWFDGLRDLGTEVIVDTFDLQGVKELVRENVEDCMTKDDVTDCLVGKVDAVANALSHDVSQKERDDARVKVEALGDFLAAVHGACADKPEDEIGACAFDVGKAMCQESDFDMKKCMGGVKFILGKAKQMAEAGDKKRGLSRDDKWFDGLRDLGTEVIVDTFDLEGVKEQVRQNVEDCMQQADVTSCLEGKVDAVSDGLGDKVSKADRDDAKIKVAALADFLAAVHGACADKPEDEIGKCAFAVGKHMCEASDFDMKKCMDGVMFVLKKAKQMADRD